jgi:hypothetical protein
MWPNIRQGVMSAAFAAALACLPAASATAQQAEISGKNFTDLPANTWIKLSPLENTPPSPRLGYEGACVWDAKHQVMMRYGGHNQGVGDLDVRSANGEVDAQGAEHIPAGNLLRATEHL